MWYMQSGVAWRKQAYALTTRLALLCFYKTDIMKVQIRENLKDTIAVSIYTVMRYKNADTTFNTTIYRSYLINFVVYLLVVYLVIVFNCTKSLDNCAKRLREKSARKG